MNNTYSIIIGKLIKEIRLKKRMTLRDLEDRTGITFSGIAKYERGRTIDLNRLMIICEKGLKVDMIEFLTEAQKRYHENDEV